MATKIQNGCQGAVHKVCHAIFDDFDPLTRHKLSQFLDPPKNMSHFWKKLTGNNNINTGETAFK